MTSQADIDALLAEAESLASEAEAVLDSGGSRSPRNESPADRRGLDTPASRLPADLQRVLKIRVPLIVRLAHKALPISRITKWVPGSIIEFERRADEPLDILTNNTCIGYGTAVKVGENFGVRITSIIDARGKLEALTSR